MLSKNNKGQVEVLFLVVIAFAFLLIVAVSYKFLTELNSDIQTNPDSNAEAKAASLDMTTRYPAIFDGGFMMFFIFVWIAILVSAWFLDTSPIFFIVSVVVFVFTVIVSLALSSSYTDIMADADFAGFASAFPMINYFATNLGLFCLAVGFSVIVVLYGKSRAANA